MPVAGVINLAQGWFGMRSQTLRIYSLGLALSVILSPSWAGSGIEFLPINHQRIDYYLDAEAKEQAMKNKADREIRRTQILVGFQEATEMLPSRKGLPTQVREQFYRLLDRFLKTETKHNK